MHEHSSFLDLTEQRFLAAKVLAFVVLDLFPTVILAGGGSHSLGFYYDFIFEQPLTESMLELIEVQMHRFIKDGHPIRSISMMRENAQNFFEHQEHFLLAELAAQQQANILDLVQIEDFYDLCPPFSLDATHEIGHIKLLESQQLTKDIQGEKVLVNRLLGTVQKTGKDLKSFLKLYDSFLKRKDHRLLGPQLHLFSFSENRGELGVIWHPKGMQLRAILMSVLKKQRREEENEISTPLVACQHFLGKEPGQLEPFLFEGEEYRVRSSLLRQHLAFLRDFPPSNEQLPFRLSESTPVFHQYPESQWWGLFCRCAYFTEQTTICCLKEQVVSELISSLHFIEQIITMFGFEAHWVLIVSQQTGSKAQREQEAIGWLKQAIQTEPRVYSCFSQEKAERGACLELRVRDVLKREWLVSRLSVILPDLPFSEKEERKERVVLTRNIWESMDRLIGLLIEHYEGVLPLWLAPEQVRVMPIGDANRAYAQQVGRLLQQKGLRVKLETSEAKLSQRIHEAEKENVPYLVLIGERERMKQLISVRVARKFNQSRTVDIETFLNEIYQESVCPIFLETK